MLDISLDLGVAEFATDETLRIEDSVVGVHCDLIFRGIADQPLVVGEGDIRGCRAVTLVVGNDLDPIVLPDTDTSAKHYETPRLKRRSVRQLTSKWYQDRYQLPWRWTLRIRENKVRLGFVKRDEERCRERVQIR